MRCRQLVLSWEKKKKGSAGQNVAIFFLLYENEKEK